MSRLIDADALLKKVHTIIQTCDGYETIERVLYVNQIENAPTVDAVPVVHGHWEHKGEGIYCSNCGAESGYSPWGASAFSKHCPECGAKMDEVTE